MQENHTNFDAKEHIQIFSKGAMRRKEEEEEEEEEEEKEETWARQVFN